MKQPGLLLFALIVSIAVVSCCSPQQTVTVEATAAPTRTPMPTMLPGKVLGISPSPPSTDAVVFVRQDGAVVLHTLVDAQEQTLLDPGTYDTSGDNSLVTIIFPARLSSDGQWLLVPTPDRGTWLTSLDGQMVRQISEQRLSFTWAPDSHRIAFQVEGAIYVQDAVTGTEPELLVRLPGDKLFYPAWSPGGDSAESVTVFSCESYVCTVWLIDVSSGHTRELGRFTPLPMMATPSEIQWSPDGTAVQVQSESGSLILPVDGRGPLPSTSAWGESRGNVSPDGALEAWAEPVPDRDRFARLSVARTGTDRQVTYDVAFEQVEGIYWTSDGRRLLVKSYSGGQRLWTVDPAAGEPVLVAEHIFFLGTSKQLQQRSTEVGAPKVSLHVLPEASDPDTWRAYGVAGWPVCLRVPPTWRIGTRGNPRTGEIWRVTVANFEFVEPEGVAPLTDDYLELSFEYRANPHMPDSFEQRLAEIDNQERYYADIESAHLGDRQAIRIRPLHSPVSEEMDVPLPEGELWITYKPLSSTQQAVLEQMLASIDFDQPCTSVSVTTSLTVKERAIVSDTVREEETFARVGWPEKPRLLAGNVILYAQGGSLKSSPHRAVFDRPEMEIVYHAAAGGEGHTIYLSLDALRTGGGWSRTIRCLRVPRCSSRARRGWLTW